MTYRFETLEILITNKGIKPVQFSKFPSNSVFTNKGAKIYIVMKDKETVYVGKTLQQIGTKLGQGFRAYQNAKNKGIRISGYGGYKWTSMFENKTLKLDLCKPFGQIIVNLQITHGDKCSGGNCVFEILTVTFCAYPVIENQYNTAICFVPDQPAETLPVFE